MKLIPTHGLRWCAGVLQQRFLGTAGSTEVWVPVPTVGLIEPTPDLRGAAPKLHCDGVTEDGQAISLLVNGSER